jgi:hypothetical protein
VRLHRRVGPTARDVQAKTEPELLVASDLATMPV